MAEHRGGSALPPLAAMGSAQPTQANKGESCLPHCLHNRQSVRDGCANDSQPRGDRLWLSHDLLQCSSVPDFHLLEEETETNPTCSRCWNPQPAKANDGCTTPNKVATTHTLQAILMVLGKEKPAQV